MKISFASIPDEGLKLPFGEKDSDWEGLQGMPLDTLPRGELFVEKSGRDVFIKGQVSAAASYSCSRCLEAFRLPIDLSFQYTLRPLSKDRREPSELELFPEDLEYGYYEDELIQLDPLIEEHILLSVPMKPLCRESCKGLCPGCGANRNEGTCSCNLEEGKSPFDVLKNMITENQ